jgi:tetratricopeptide (TPR) repeat protein
MHRLERPAFDEARGLLEAAVEADPAYGPARSYLALWHLSRGLKGWSDDLDFDGRASGVRSSEALELNARDALALAIRSLHLSYHQHRHAEAIDLLDRALALAPRSLRRRRLGLRLSIWRSAPTSAGFSLPPCRKLLRA